MAETKKMNINEKLLAIQSELKAPKGQYNSFGKYKYRSAEDILEAVKPLLAKHKALLILTDEIKVVGEEIMSDNKTLRTYVSALAQFIDTESDGVISVSAMAREPQTKTGMDASQITGTASSYARKYALNGLFCIDDTKDADTDEYHNEVENTPKSSVEDICKGIQEKMTLDNWKGFYKKAIGLYPKGTPEYDSWIETFNNVKNSLESAQTDKSLEEDKEFLNNI